MDSRIRFIVAGDGDKRDLLEQTRDAYNLSERLTILGAVEHQKVKDVLAQGDILLNTSLTEAFCIAMVEGASAGLLVVSTNVGGVNEVLPEDLLVLTDLTPESIISGIKKAISMLPAHSKDKAHTYIKNTYSWTNVSIELEKIYNKFEKPSLQKNMSPLRNAQRLLRARDRSFSLPWKILLVFTYFILRLRKK